MRLDTVSARIAVPVLTPCNASRIAGIAARMVPRAASWESVTTDWGVEESDAACTEAHLLFEDYAKGFQSVSTDKETYGWITDIGGEIPKEITGTLLRNGPALFERNGVRKEFLDGDGMITSIAIKDGKAYFRNRFVRTQSFQREEQEGDFLDLSIFTAADPRVAKTGRAIWEIRLFDDIFNGPPSPKNNGAFNVWHWGESLVAVDFSRPFQLDKHDLQTVERTDSFAQHDFTAHSRLMTEADGSKRLVCFLPFVDWATQTTTITFYEFDVDGSCLVKKEFQFGAAYFHDLIVTDKWYILFDCPIKMDYFRTFVRYPLGQVGLGDTVSEDRERPPIFRLFPRRTNGDMIEVPVIDKHCYAYHHVNGFDVNEDGSRVVFDTCTWDRFTLYFKDIVEPDGERHFPRTQLTRFTIDLDKREATSKTLNKRPCEYPTVAPSATGVEYAHMYMSGSAVSFDHCNGPMQSLTKVTYDSKTEMKDETTWYPGKRKFVGEPLFVAREGAKEEDDGWIVILVHDGGENCGTELAILDAQDIEAGPVASLRLPTYVPMGVHGSWTPRYILGPNE